MFENINKNEKNVINGMDNRIESNEEFSIKESFDPDKRIRIDQGEGETSDNKFKDFKSISESINDIINGKSLEEIIALPFENFIDNIKNFSLDTIALSASYVTSCKMLCADIVDKEKRDDLKNNVHLHIKEELTKFFSAPEFANKFIQEYGVGPDKLKEAVGDITEFVLGLGKAIFYVYTRISIGVVGILDNACRAVYSMGLYALGNSEQAKEVMTESNLDKFRQFLDDTVQPNKLEKKIGDIADNVGEIVGELALAIIGALGITASAPIAAAGIIGAVGVLAFDAAGKNLEKNVEKSGEYGKKEFLSALLTVGITVVVERLLPCINNISSDKNIIKIADKVGNVVNDNTELGIKLTKFIITGLKSSAGIATFKGAEEVQKVVDYALGINDKLDIKKEILQTIGLIGGVAALGGVLSFVTDTVVRSRVFHEVLQKFNIDCNPRQTKYDVLYKKVELTKAYLQDIIDKSEVPETITKNILDPESLYKESCEIVKNKRNDFTLSKKNKLIEEWEINTGKEWPRYKEDLYITLKDGTKKMLHKAGNLYDAHHIRPLSWGGENIWQNITPLNADIHFDARGVHAIDSAYDKLSKLMEGLL